MRNDPNNSEWLIKFGDEFCRKYPNRQPATKPRRGHYTAIRALWRVLNFIVPGKRFSYCAGYPGRGGGYDLQWNFTRDHSADPNVHFPEGFAGPHVLCYSTTVWRTAAPLGSLFATLKRFF